LLRTIDDRLLQQAGALRGTLSQVVRSHWHREQIDKRAILVFAVVEDNSVGRMTWAKVASPS
jgi:hypothetical protein